MGKISKHRKEADGQMSRKDKRKLLRKEKKERKNTFYHKKDDNQIRAQTSNNLIGKDKKQIKVRAETLSSKFSKEEPKKKVSPLIKSQNKKGQYNSSELIKQVKVKKSRKELEDEEEIMREQKQIQYYEKLLGVNKRKGKYKGIAKGLGYEDDLFDFLDNISKKVKGGDSSQAIGQEGMNDSEDEEMMDSQMESESQVNGQEGSQDEGHYDEEDILGQEQEENFEEGDDYGEELQGESYDDMIVEQNEEDQFDEEENSQNQDSHQQQSGSQNDQYDQEFQNDQNQDQIEQEQMDQDEMAMWQELEQQTNKNTKKSKTPDNKNTQILKNTIKQVPNKKQNQKQKEIKSTLKPTTGNKQDSSQENQPNATSKIQGRRPLFGNMTADQKEQQQIRKQMNGIFNKLSDGNLMISFRQFSEIFLSAPKGTTIPVFINLFIRFNVQVQKPHLHILLSNIALASALHHLMGNRLMGPLTYELIKKFNEYENTAQNQEQIQEIGYSKIFERKKNVILIFSYLYDFGSLTGDFIYGLVKHLSQSLNQHNVELLYAIIQKIGSKVRQNDPGVLKQIIQTLRQSINSFKNTATSPQSQVTKINIIQIELNQLKFNRKQPLFSDQRMAFFSTFLNKNVPNQLNTEKEVLLPNFEQIKLADVSRTNWWENLQHTNQHANQQVEQNEADLEMINELTAERKQLIDLAKSLNLVTEIRKNIFVQIMEASDYIEATQRVLSLKIKNLHQIAIVLIQACVLQPTFNPFYPLVAAKISNINPKFKSKVQFTIWDHIKLLDSYNPRKISNLAKFTARYVGSPLTNGSLSILKYFPDFINVHPYEAMFLMIFFSEFLTVTKKQTLAQISVKLKEDSNRQIKDAILEYLKQVGVRQKGFNNMDKMKFLRRMILLNEKQIQGEERF